MNWALANCVAADVFWYLLLRSGVLARISNPGKVLDIMVPSSRFYHVFRAVGFAASFLTLLAIVSIAGCKKKYATGGPQGPTSPEDIKELVKLLAKKQRVSFVEDIRIPSAERLGDIGPPAAEHGAVPALEKMAADKDPKVKEVAQKALAKIKAAPAP